MCNICSQLYNTCYFVRLLFSNPFLIHWHTPFMQLYHHKNEICAAIYFKAIKNQIIRSRQFTLICSCCKWIYGTFIETKNSTFSCNIVHNVNCLLGTFLESLLTFSFSFHTFRCINFDRSLLTITCSAEIKICRSYLRFTLLVANLDPY